MHGDHKEISHSHCVCVCVCVCVVCVCVHTCSKKEDVLVGALTGIISLHHALFILNHLVYTVSHIHISTHDNLYTFDGC